MFSDKNPIIVSKKYITIDNTHKIIDKQNLIFSEKPTSKKPAIKKTVYTGEIADIISTIKSMTHSFTLTGTCTGNTLNLIPIFDYLLVHINCICNVDSNLTRLVDTITSKIKQLKEQCSNQMKILLYGTLDTNTINDLKIYINFLSLIDSVNNKISETYQQFGSHKLIVKNKQRFGSPDRSITPKHRFESPCVTPERFESPTRSITPKRFGSPKLITK